jgi:hypothetical protein
MTTIQEQLFALIDPLAAGGACPYVQEIGAPLPYIVYQRVQSPVENTLSGNGAPPINNTVFDITSWGASYADAVSTAAAVTAAMQAWSVQNVLQHELDLYESDVKLFRVVQTFSTWHY